MKAKHKWVEIAAGVEWCRECGKVRAWQGMRGKFYWQVKTPKGTRCSGTFPVPCMETIGLHRCEMVKGHHKDVSPELSMHGCHCGYRWRG